ncbi:hypothetical protein GCM10009718_27950 [Isoptericola halotolerans]|uniref:Cellulose biosynthesis protein BcsQ n=1 Tax=Isoptericola halotolerans TaxID=300560 RepID=A0ABX2A616_9MICO|nr:hypothetical protein [Isoptericola halotolerans]NOV97355.1 hypothetical protein [Isoptericola halotolerans]
MALVALTSAGGSPGVTSTALGLALSWPRPVVLVEADPSGSRALAAGYFRGGQLPTTRTLVDLAVSHRQGSLVEDLPRTLFSIPDSKVQVLTGPLRHSQARALDQIWGPLAGLFKSLERQGQDVIVDIGRLGLEGSGYQLLAAADLALLTTRTDLPSLVAAGAWAATLRQTFERGGALHNLGALLVGQGRPYGSGEAAKVLGLPVVASLAWDPDTAQVYSHGAAPGRKFATAPLNKSLRAAVQAAQSTVGAVRSQLELAIEGSPR